MSELPTTIATDATRTEGESTTAESVTPVIAVDAVIPETLLAGKYKTQDEFVKAYKHAETKIGELSTRLKEYEVPVDYTIELDIPAESATKIKELAKESGLSQGQLTRMLNAMRTKEMAQIEARNAALKVESDAQVAKLKAVEEEIGLDVLQKLDAYVESNFPGKMGEKIKHEYRQDKMVADEFAKARELSLRKVLPTDGYVGELTRDDMSKEMLALAPRIAADPKAAKRFSELAQLKAKSQKTVA